jgi:DNA-binding transcriptional regulator YiaG
MSTQHTDSGAGKVRAAREQLGESQAAFGARFGVDQSTVHLWETRGIPGRGTARVALERLFDDLKAQQRKRVAAR